MYPFLHIFGINISTYYVCAALAGIVGFLLAAHALSRPVRSAAGAAPVASGVNAPEGTDFRPEPVVNGAWRWFLPLIAEVLAVIGARLFNVLINPSNYNENFHAWTLTYSHLSLIGGLALGLAGILIYCLIAGKDPRPVFDAFVLPAGCGIVILKIGCFLNGCCFGKSTKLPWGMEFPSNESAYASIDPLGIFSSGKHIVHPTQLYEILGALIALGLALLLKKHLGAGGSAAIFAAAFSIARWIVLPYRVLGYPEYVINTLYPILYGGTALLGIGYAVWSTGAFGKEKRGTAIGNEKRGTAFETEKRGAAGPDGKENTRIVAQIDNVEIVSGVSE